MLSLQVIMKQDITFIYKKKKIIIFVTSASDFSLTSLEKRECLCAFTKYHIFTLWYMRTDGYKRKHEFTHMFKHTKVNTGLVRALCYNSWNSCLCLCIPFTFISFFSFRFISFISMHKCWGMETDRDFMLNHRKRNLLHL